MLRVSPVFPVMQYVPADFFEFLSTQFTACSKPPSRDNHCNSSYSSVQQRDRRVQIKPRSYILFCFYDWFLSKVFDKILMCLLSAKLNAC